MFSEGRRHGRSEHVENEVIALVIPLLAPVVPAVRVPLPEHSVATVEVPVVRALNLGNNTLLPRIEIPSIVEPGILEAVAGDLRWDVGPMQVIGPILGPGSAPPEQRNRQRERFER